MRFFGLGNFSGSRVLQFWAVGFWFPCKILAVFRMGRSLMLKRCVNLDVKLRFFQSYCFLSCSIFRILINRPQRPSPYSFVKRNITGQVDNVYHECVLSIKVYQVAYFCPFTHLNLVKWCVGINMYDAYAEITGRILIPFIWFVLPTSGLYIRNAALFYLLSYNYIRVVFSWVH